MKRHKITLERVNAAVEEDSNSGFCLTCGHWQHGVEPDAREYECERCDASQVYGAEEILLMLALS